MKDATLRQQIIHELELEPALSALPGPFRASYRLRIGQ